MRRRVRKVIGWGVLLLFAVAVGGGWFAYSYVTDSEMLRAAIRDGAPRFLPGSRRRRPGVQLQPLAGRSMFNDLSNQKIERPTGLVGISPWLQVSSTPGRCSTASSS